VLGILASAPTRTGATLLRRITQAWFLAVILGSLQPRRPGSIAGLHREIHWVAFAGAAFFLLLSTRSRLQAIHRALGTLLLGLALEYVQHLIYHKAMEWLDVGDDALAILAALALYWWAVRRNPPAVVSQPDTAPVVD
jgi:hypothetical protein